MSLIEQIFSYYVTNGAYVWVQFGRHFLIAVYGVVFAAVLSVPLGFFLARRHRLADWVIGVALSLIHI